MCGVGERTVAQRLENVQQFLAVAFGEGRIALPEQQAIGIAPGQCFEGCAPVPIRIKDSMIRISLDESPVPRFAPQI